MSSWRERGMARPAAMWSSLRTSSPICCFLSSSISRAVRRHVERHLRRVQSIRLKRGEPACLGQARGRIRRAVGMGCCARAADR